MMDISKETQYRTALTEVLTFFKKAQKRDIAYGNLHTPQKVEVQQNINRIEKVLKL